MRIADSHSHIFSEAFDADRDEVVTRAMRAGVVAIVMPNISSASLHQITATANRYPNVALMALGVHPEAVKETYKEELATVREAIERFRGENQVVAIGEIGLDYYWDTTYAHEQRIALRMQLEWALELDLPVIIHTRSAHSDMVHAVGEYASKGLRGVFHSFGGSKDELEELLAFEGFMIGINGIATFKKSDDLRALLPLIPPDRLLLETDAPYLAPVPKRGKRNEPAFSRYTLAVIAECLGLTDEEAAERTFENYKTLFKRRGVEK